MEQMSCIGEDMDVICVFKDTGTTEIYTLSLHDALPIFARRVRIARRTASALHLDDSSATAFENDVPPAQVAAQGELERSQNLAIKRRGMGGLLPPPAGWHLEYFVHGAMGQSLDEDLHGHGSRLGLLRKLQKTE